MLSGVIQISGGTLSNVEIVEICTSLKNHQVTVLSFRKCKVECKDFKKLMRSVGKSTSLVQLNLSINMLSSDERILYLAEALDLNRSVKALFLHGNPLGEQGLGLLSKALYQHPSIVNLDLGDCQLNDICIKLICNLLPPDGAKSGLKELVLSANPAVSQNGWSYLFCAIAASSCLRSLSVDYNPVLGDTGAKMLAVIVSGSRSLQCLDLEGCALTNSSAKVLLNVLENFPTSLQKLVLTGNSISAQLQEKIVSCLIQTEFSE